MYAIVDIETTGGNTIHTRIIEIAILVHNGKEIVKSFTTLVNPECKIPYYISKFTGITDEMVWNAPTFCEIAKQIVELTEDTIFVAHNARFDYAIIKAAFRELGYNYERNIVSTLMLSKNTFQGISSYSLKNLCESLGIEMEQHHRAHDDAMTTAKLLYKILEINPEAVKTGLLEKEIKKSPIPFRLNYSAFEKIPPAITGVYYFHNKNGEVIYVGKSIDIKKRLLQHFSSQKTGKAIRMLDEIADVSFENTGNELLALLLESSEIKNHKPLYNVSQKRTRTVPFYGIFQKRDRRGYINLYIKRLRNGEEPILAIESIFNANAILERVVEKFRLCLSKCGLHKTGGACFNYQLHYCNGACVLKEAADDYNRRANKAIKSFSFENECFFLVGCGRNKNEKSIICIEKGKYKGFGFFDFTYGSPGMEEMHNTIKNYDHNRNIQQILASWIKNPVFKKEWIKIPFKPIEDEIFIEPQWEN